MAMMPWMGMESRPLNPANLHLELHEGLWRDAHVRFLAAAGPVILWKLMVETDEQTTIRKFSPKK